MSRSCRSALDLVDRTFRSKPLVFLVAAWIAGIGIADHWAIAPGLAGGVGLAFGAAALASRHRWRALGLLLLGMAGLGTSATRMAMTPPRGDISRWAGQQVAVEGFLDSEPGSACDRWRFFLSCSAVTYGRRTYPTQGRLYVSTDQDLSGREPGDMLLVYGVPERPSPARNPGGFSAECWLSRHGVFAALSARHGGVVPLGGAVPDWRRVAGWVRHQIAGTNRRVMRDPEAAALVNSILFGDLDQDDPWRWGAIQERFRRAGLSHVLVVSGAQIALLFGLLAGWRQWAQGARRGPRQRYWRLVRFTGGYSLRRALLGGLILVGPYVLLCGLEPSVLRAGLVVAIFFVGRCLDRETDPENSLAAAALILLVGNPLTLYDLGFQLSFAAVWGILRWTEPLTAVLRRLWPGSRAVEPDGPSANPIRPRGPGLAVTAAAFSLAAQLATAPLVAHHFQMFSVSGLAANLPVYAMADLLLPLGLASSSLSAVVMPPHGPPPLLVSWLNLPTELLARLINWSVTVFAGPRWASIFVSPPGWAEVALVGLLLVAGSTPAAKRRGMSLWAAGLALAVLAVAILRPAPPIQVPTFTFIDVGQGDGCLIRLPGGATMLVDGGGSPRAPCERRDCSDAPLGDLAACLRPDCRDVGHDMLARYLRYERVRRIDLMVLTHPHDDHLWGLDAILDPREGFELGTVLDAERPLATPAWREWDALLRRRHLAPIVTRRGMELTLGPARLVVLHPPNRFLSHTHSDPNNNSIVLRLEVEGRRVLLTGDAETEAEASMAGEDVQAEVLKAGHHGSATSSSDAWLERVRPRIAIISCGPHNPFGHPSPATLDRLERHGAQVYRTDQDGAVTLELRPEGWRATTMIAAGRAGGHSSGE